MSVSPLVPQPGQSYLQPFELLEACHARVQGSLDLLARLCVHLAQRRALDQGPDAMARDAARDVLRYFDIAAPLHHQDEERHVFPALSTDAELAPLCQELIRQHGEIEQQWRQQLRPLLQTLEPADLDALQLAAQRFAELHADHLRSEDARIFPAARARLDEAGQRAMGREMAARRGLSLGGDSAPARL